MTACEGKKHADFANPESGQSVRADISYDLLGDDFGALSAFSVICVTQGYPYTSQRHYCSCHRERELLPSNGCLNLFSIIRHPSCRAA